MATRNVKTVFAVQGESEYRKAVQNINREIKEANSELKLLSEQYRGQEDSMAALQDKQKALTDLYAKQAEKIGKIEEALKNAQDAAEKYARKGTDLRDELQKNADDMAALADAGEKASEAYQKLVEKDKELKKAISDNDAKYEAASKGISDWKIKLNDAKTELIKTQSAMDDTAAKLKGDVVPEFEAVEEKVDRAGDAFRQFRDKASENMDAVASAIAAAGVEQAFEKVLGAMQDCIDKSMEFESAMTGVFKTVDMTLEEEVQLSKDIRAMAEEIPVTTTEIAGVAELAGQLGISNDALLGFTETMVKLGTATNLTAADAAEALAKIANIAQTAETDYGRMGSTIVALGNNFATTEADIVSMATRLAATGEVVGLTEAQIFAVATALSSVGIEAEAGGSAISKLLKEIETAVVTYDTASAAIERTGYSLRDLELMQSNNNLGFKYLADDMGLTTQELKRYINTVKDLNKYAEISGQTAEEFNRSWGDDAVLALDRFITGLGNIDQVGGNAVETMQDMGLTEIRLSNAVLALSASGGILTDTLNIANKAWEQNSALSEEAAKRFETTESKVQILKNSFDNLQIAIGDDYMTTLKPVIEGLTELTQNLSSDAADSPALASTLAGIGGALGGLTVLTAVAAGIKLVAGALSVFGSAGGIAAIGVSALTGLAAGVTTYIANVTEVSDAAQAVIDKNGALVEAYGKSKTAYEEEMGAIGLNREEVEKLIEKVVALSDEVNKTPADEAIIKEVVARLNKLLPGLGLTYDGVTEKINLTRDAMQKFAKEVEKTAKLEAFEKYLAELTGNQAAMQAQMDITGVKIQEARDKYQEAKKALKEYSDGMSNLEWILRYADENWVDLAEAEAQTLSELNKLKDSQVEIQDALKGTNSDIAAAMEAYDQYVEELGYTAEKARESGYKTAEEYAAGIEEGETVVQESTTALKDAATEGLAGTDAGNAGKEFAQGFAEGIESKTGVVEQKAAELARAAESAMKAAAEIASPSKKAKRLGRFWGEGIAVGIAESGADVSAAVQRLSTELDIAPEVAGQVRAAQAELGKLHGGAGTAIDPAAEYRNSMAAAERIAAQASQMGKSGGVPIEITVVSTLDGQVVSRSVSRTQYVNSRTAMRTNGVKVK